MSTMKIMNPYSCLLMVLLCFMISVISTTLLGGGVVAQESSTRVSKLQEVPKDRCGKDFGGAMCSDGRCCSEYGWCGTTATYCGIGCQSQCHDVKYECGWQAKGAKCEEGLCCSNYGFCGNTTAYCANGNCQSQCHTVNPLSTRVAPHEVPQGRCGRDFGCALCSDGNCCSEYGWCGTTATHCGIGCQSQCQDVKYDCGWQAKGAKCEEGLCCSIYGFCGNTTANCADGNCQSQCHAVKSLSTGVAPREVPQGRCGRDFGCALCSDGSCCSEYGWCGTTATYCGIGCQSQCQDVKYQCGWQAKGAKCEEGLCCSVYGFCGNTTAYCAKGNCQSQCTATLEGGNQGNFIELPLGTS